VDELDDGGQHVPLMRRFAERAGHEQQQCRAQPLAARADDVLGDLVDQQHVGREALPDNAIHLLHVAGDRGEQVGGAEGGGGGGRRHDDGIG